MDNEELPKKTIESGKEYNRISGSDIQKLSADNQKEYKNNNVRFQKRIELLQNKYDINRETRVREEMDAMLNKPRPDGMEGQKPVFGGKRVDGAKSVARKDHTPEQLRDMRAEAEKTTRKWEEKQLENEKKAHLKAQREFLDRALGRDRYPEKRR